MYRIYTNVVFLRHVRQEQDTQFLLIENKKTSLCFIEQNDAAYCLLINRNCVPWDGLYLGLVEQGKIIPHKASNFNSCRSCSTTGGMNYDVINIGILWIQNAPTTQTNIGGGGIVWLTHPFYYYNTLHVDMWKVLKVVFGKKANDTKICNLIILNYKKTGFNILHYEQKFN